MRVDPAYQNMRYWRKKAPKKRVDDIFNVAKKHQWRFMNKFNRENAQAIAEMEAEREMLRQKRAKRQAHRFAREI